MTRASFALRRSHALAARARRGGTRAAQHAVQSARRSTARIVPTRRQDARAPRPDVDEDDARQRRAARRLGEARPAARLVPDQLRRRRESVRAGRTRPGSASFVAQMLTEGTTHRTGDQISNDLQLLGTSVGTAIGGESGRMCVSVDEGQVRADARDSRRRAREPDVPAAGARSASRARRSSR